MRDGISVSNSGLVSGWLSLSLVPFIAVSATMSPVSLCQKMWPMRLL